MVEIALYRGTPTQAKETWEGHPTAIALHFAYYNFCRVHSSLRVTPAMEAGLTDHVWTFAELFGTKLGIQQVIYM